MKQADSNQKTTQHSTQNTDQSPSAGPQGIGITPPAYGIESADSGGELVIQPRLMVGAAGDSYEREADYVAQQVMRMHAPPRDVATVRPHENTGGDDLTQRKPLASGITSLVQRSGTGQGFEAGSQVAGEVSRQRGRGSALDGGVRKFMEPRFGADFSGVRVHTNPQADTLNRALSARAFTTGRDIFFRGGEYRPGSASGRELIAHELTHVVQQSGETPGTSDGTVQRLIINTGDTTLPTELGLVRGWIVGSDMDIAYHEGGDHQRVEEFGSLSATKVGKAENIYLEGHGSPGKLGHQEPRAVAQKLNKIIPTGYTGKIRSHSCSAGVGVSGVDKPSGVDALAVLLHESGIDVEGASGIALNHMTFTRSGGSGTRSFDKSKSSVVDEAIARTRGTVDKAWAGYISGLGSIVPSKYRGAAAKATEISEEFYSDLEMEVDTALIDKDKSILRSTSALDLDSSSSGGSGGKSNCFITTACTQARGLPDDCLELTTLRAFRDEYIASLANGKKMIRVYYENSPRIVAAIDRRADAAETYNGLYAVVCNCVRYVQEGAYDSAFQTYVDMVIQLRNRFTPMAKIPAFFYKDFKSDLRS